MQRISFPQITKQPSPLDLVVKAELLKAAERWMFLRNLALRGTLEAFVAIHMLDHLNSIEKIEQWVDDAIKEGWK